MAGWGRGDIIAFLSLVVTVGGVVVAAVTVPEVRHWIGLKDPSPVGVTLSDVHVTFQPYGDSAEWISFKAQIEGYQGTVVSVVWTLYDAQTGAVTDAWPGLSRPSVIGCSAGRISRYEGLPAATFTPNVQSQSFSGEIHIPGRPLARDVTGRSWKVSLEAFKGPYPSCGIDDTATRLTFAETERFSLPEPPSNSDPR